ncbi:MAG: EI24 domain-containing protein [Burkholderiales bacterium]|nr:EI24 domain-containing protein [Burkholderiales bacterium]MDE2565495.1 EI24 domain-containing protein [Burkholderiales bacterium]
MAAVFDAFWRAVAYCLHPRVIALSLLPLAVAGGAAALLGWAYWASAVAAVRALLEQWSLVAALLQWLDSMGWAQLHALIAPLIVVALAVPVVVVVTLLLVAALATPAMVRLVAARRFGGLEARQGGSWWQSLAWSLACTLAAGAALVLSLPLWFVPPLALVLPPLIWGWLTYRVLAFDVLAQHASAAERRHLLRRERWPLLAMGVACGLLGAMPSLLWALSALTLIVAPLLMLVSVWLYTLVFAFAAAWFAHYLLAALQGLRALEAAAASVVVAPGPGLPLPLPLSSAAPPAAPSAAPPALLPPPP